MALPEPLATDLAVGDPLPAALNEERTAINLIVDEVEDRIPFPSGAAFGDLLRWNGSAWETTETRFLEGEGRPDGQVAAPVGSRYIDKVGAQGAVEWVKRSGGSTNVGWICLAGDTDKRDISANILTRTNTIVHSAFIMRSGQIVQLYVDITMPTNTASPYKIYDIPSGFRPVADLYGGLLDNKEGADTGGTRVAAAGDVNIYGIVAGKRDRYHGTWVTRDAWPSALPGASA